MVDVIIERLVQFTNNARSRWQWLGYVITTATIAYIAILLLYGGIQLRHVDIRQFLPAIIMSFFIYFVSLAVQFAIWARLFSFHHRVGWRDVDIYSRMILMRRLPGGLWHWVGRTALYSSTTTVPPKIAMLANVWS